MGVVRDRDQALSRACRRARHLHPEGWVVRSQPGTGDRPIAGDPSAPRAPVDRTKRSSTQEEPDQMAVRIRLTRVGATKQPTYRIVVADSRSARDSRAIETIGHYNPRTDPIELSVDADKAKAWLAKGAQPSDTVVRLLRNAGIVPADKK